MKEVVSMPLPRAAEVPVPPVVGDLDLFGRVDYEDAYSVPAVPGRTPEQWMRGFLGDAPAWFLFTWATAGTLLLGARSSLLRGDDHIFGWRVLFETPDLYAIGLDSYGGLDARLIAVTTAERAVIATQVHLGNPYARAWWKLIRPAHRHVARALLERTAR